MSENTNRHELCPSRALRAITDYDSGVLRECCDDFAAEQPNSTSCDSSVSHQVQRHWVAIEGEELRDACMSVVTSGLCDLWLASTPPMGASERKESWMLMKTGRLPASKDTM